MFTWLENWKNLSFFKLARSMQKQNEDRLEAYERLIATQREDLVSRDEEIYSLRNELIKTKINLEKITKDRDHYKGLSDIQNNTMNTMDRMMSNKWGEQ